MQCSKTSHDTCSGKRVTFVSNHSILTTTATCPTNSARNRAELDPSHIPGLHPHIHNRPFGADSQLMQICYSANIPTQSRNARSP
mmetsp:Transcript_26184/g.55563  ORF Transcript_26184/g.55563 Transcript_26184/m.55563 type:complete len:85 (-) Transcript_26184:426-680(-)